MRPKVRRIAILGHPPVPRTTLKMPGPTPHRTPLRRISQGSLFALSRSENNPDTPYGLGFLEPALAELADEADALHANVAGLRALGDSLQTFNESFASWLYVLNMNALTVDWPQVRLLCIGAVGGKCKSGGFCDSRRHRQMRHTCLQNAEQVRVVTLNMCIHVSISSLC